MRAERDSTVESEVTKLVAQLARGRKDDLGPDAQLADLGLDSLAVADLAVALEERFGVRLADADATGLRSVGDVVSALAESAEPRPRIPVGIGRLQRTSKAVAGPILKWQARLRVRGTENVPGAGPVVLAANHRSFLDIPLLVVASPRPIVFMAKQELFRNVFFGRLLHELGGFPVRREIADLRAIDVGLAVLERGDLLGVYPEGTRNYGQDLLPFLKGAAWLGLKTGVPIVPCGIVGTERRRPGAGKPLRRHVRISFGPPIHVERETDALARQERADAITGELRRAITPLLA